MNKKLLIVAAYHKQAYVPNSDIILPMQVGASVAKVQLNMVKDNVGENISELNPYYCELTALYSLWRNYSDVEYYGLCHYRRFFSYRHRNFANHFFKMFHITEQNWFMSLRLLSDILNCHIFWCLNVI